jgi:uncharacterized protein YciI
LALFVLICRDHKGVLERRVATRPAHLAYIDQHRPMLKVAGPILDDDGQMAGSLFVLEAETRAEVEAFAAGDPFTTGGVFESSEISAFRATVGGFA